jgi:hypothetical protein
VSKWTKTNIEINFSGISFERLDGEVVIISFETGKYFNTNGPAADLLHLIENRISQNLWAQILGSSFEDFREDQAGIQDFLETLILEKIVVESVEISNELIDLPSDYSRGSWSKPSLLVFDDLTDLLLIDPIHDTSLEGWPTVKSE